MRNNNQAIVRKITRRTLSSDKKRNFFVIAAITLTAFMIASVLSIGTSYYETINMREKRMQGSISQMAFAALNEEQIERVYSLDYVETVGLGSLVAKITDAEIPGDIDMAYVDATQWREMFCPTFTGIVGHYPAQENEVMLSRHILEAMNIENPEIGMQIPLTYTINGTDETRTEVFTLSCIYTEYAHSRPGGAVAIYTSYDFAERHGKTAPENITVNVIFSSNVNVGESVERLRQDLNFSENQPYIKSPAFDDNNGDITTYVALLAIVVLLMFAGYLLIYNVMYISVSRDVRFYGMLKTMGTTPRQIRRIVFGQVMWLCIIGLLIGCAAASAVSLLIVPAVLLNSGIHTGAVVSFSPVIYGGAVLFTVATSLLGAFIPAKKAADISPIEASRYTDGRVHKSNVHRSAKGKPYKMALRNIFRVRKRAAVVILSLFIGVTIFTAVMTTVTSLDVDHAANAEYAYDYSLSSSLTNSYFLSDDLVNEIKELDGIAEAGITTLMSAELMYSEMLDRYIDWIVQSEGIPREAIIVDHTFAWAHGLRGIDLLALEEINANLPIPIDVEAFERGEIALINIGSNEDIADSVAEVRALEIKLAPNEAPIGFEVGGVVSLHGGSFSYSEMEILVSNTFMQRHFSEPQILSLDMNVEQGYDEQIYNLLNETVNQSEVTIVSRYAARKAMQEAKTIMFALGGGISCILGLIGIFNFVNVMSVGIMVRKREFATLESIGMEKKKIRLMLMFEGLGYAIIAILLTATAGNAAAYGIFGLFKLWADYAVFSYPVVPVLIVFLLIIAVCGTAPEVAYRSINKATLVERLREAE